MILCLDMGNGQARGILDSLILLTVGKRSHPQNGNVAHM